LHCSIAFPFYLLFTEAFTEQPFSHPEYHYFLVCSAFQTLHFFITKCIYVVLKWQIFLNDDMLDTPNHLSIKQCKGPTNVSSSGTHE